MPSDKNEYARNYYRERFKKEPWLRKLMGVRGRCSQKISNYKKRGIKCFLKLEDVKMLWFRDKAYNLKEPSLHRIDNDGHYTIENCCFIERRKNTSLGNKGKKLSSEHKKIVLKNLEKGIDFKKGHKYHPRKEKVWWNKEVFCE